jgi:hypothetical protein
MIIEFGNFNFFKTQCNDSSLIQNIDRKVSLTKLNNDDVFRVYKNVLEEFKQELSLSGNIVVHQSWINNYSNDDFIGVHNHSILFDGKSFTAIHYLQYDDDHAPTYFMIDGQKKELKVNQNDFVIHPTDILHGVDRSINATRNRITLIFDFSVFGDTAK